MFEATDFQHCEVLLAGGADLEDVIKYLKEKGYTQGPTWFFLERLGIEPNAAKKAVIESKAWKL